MEWNANFPSDRIRVKEYTHLQVMNGKERIRIHHLGTRGLFADKYSDIRDDSPDEVARKAEGQYPGVGIRMLRGHPD